MRRTTFAGDKVYSEVGSSGTYAIWKWTGRSYVLKYISLDEYDPSLHRVNFRVSKNDWDTLNLKLKAETNK